MANNINIVITAEDKASKPIRSISDEMDNASGSSSKFRSALGSLGGALKATAIAGGLTALAFGTAGTAIGFGFNSSVEQAQTKLMAFMQDNERVAKTLEWVKAEAAATQFSFTDMADAAANLTPVSKSTGVALEDLVKQAEILAAVNPAEGLTGATFSLREALSGDWVSIVDRFNLPRKRINELKAQGVPAMEIISKTLGEMGINYDLVAKQGQTVSARFDQVKDKLTIMAGAASKPIFDRVSNELNNLAAFDYNGTGEKLAGIVSGAIKAFDDFVPKVQEVAKQVGDYLGPKFETVWKITQDKLFPALQRLWKQVIEPMVPVIGTFLVGALGGLVDVLGWALEAATPLINFLADNQWVIWTVVGAFVALKTALLLQSAFTAVTALFTTFTTVTVPAATATMTTFKTLVTTPMVMPAIAIGAALASIGVLMWAIDDYNKNYAAAIEQNKKNPYLNGTYDKGKVRMQNGVALPNFASGTNAAEGGWSLVGEHGPEVVRMPKGAEVTPAYRSRQGVGGGGATIAQLIVHNHYPNDQQRLVRDIGFALELAS